MTAGLEILNLHAQGGMAEVYRARAADAQGRTWFYAVKRILPELLKEPEMLRMFIEEQKIAACLVHENIVRVYDVASGNASDYFIVMEFLEGRDLHEWIEAARNQNKVLPVWLAIHLAREVLKALTYATTEARDKKGRVLGLIHRDISPHNIFLTVEGAVKLTDFGVARVETAEVKTRAGIIKGKFGYMSPEQLSGQQLDFRSDLYNVGILLYETITCKQLFHGETATQFIASMMSNEVPRLDPKLLVPPELDALMRRALSKKKDERPQNAKQFEQELSAIAARYGLEAAPSHVAAEIRSLFPELEPRDPTTEPIPQAAAIEAAERVKQEQGGKLLKSVIDDHPGAEEIARIEHTDDEGDVFAESRPFPKAPGPSQRANNTPAKGVPEPISALRDTDELQTIPRPFSGPPKSQAPAQPSKVVSTPSKVAPVPAARPAPAAPPIAAPPPSPDDAMDGENTLYEQRPDLDNLVPHELDEETDDVPRTEPLRMPVSRSDLPAPPKTGEVTTSPQRRPAPSALGSPTWDDVTLQTDGPLKSPISGAAQNTGDLKRPPSKAVIPQAPNRVSTGRSKRVISLEGDEETSGPHLKRRK